MKNYEFRTESVWCHLACLVQAMCYHRDHVFCQIDSLAHVEMHLFYITILWGGGILRFSTQIAHTITLINKVMQTIT